MNAKKAKALRKQARAIMVRARFSGMTFYNDRYIRSSRRGSALCRTVMPTCFRGVYRRLKREHGHA